MFIEVAYYPGSLGSSRMLENFSSNMCSLGSLFSSQQRIMSGKGRRASPKLVFDDRLADTTRVLRACRLFNYEFVARTPLAALREEIATVSAIPRCYDNMDLLEAELKQYQHRARGQFVLAGQRPSLWDFWCAAALALPTW